MDQDVSFSAGIPQLMRFTDSRLNLVIIGRDLPELDTSEYIPFEILSDIGDGEGAMLVASPDTQATCDYVESEGLRPNTTSFGIEDGRCVVHDTVFNISSFLMFDVVNMRVKEGQYRMALYNRKNTTTKLWFLFHLPSFYCII